ncbi:hypothetical protein HPO96_37225 [Kribbella sandramycini]|uniref:Uncharacterized protein n=1 Tax=Kribbella sandramycini TaxID=60450 RepID=A0A7Y4P494_9ACTN|nr:hypothetical protein [Kribbella sandramycini]MBB6564447.1 hypothetical protein [Kribbella sandramycini]NOL45903.1 hypothetical protein [Kribbella sandramycini]
MSDVDPAPVRRTFTLEFYDEIMANEFETAIARGEDSYVIVPTEHRIFGWDRPQHPHRVRPAGGRLAP